MGKVSIPLIWGPDWNDRNGEENVKNARSTSTRPMRKAMIANRVTPSGLPIIYFMKRDIKPVWYKSRLINGFQSRNKKRKKLMQSNYDIC